MKNKSILLSIGLMVFITSICRVLPNRPYGFSSQIALALFAGSIFVKNKKLAFLLPLISMFISDILYQIFYYYGYSEMPGFYNGQWINYLLISSLTVFGFLISDLKISKVILSFISAPTVYFLLSNALVWIGNGGYHHSRDMVGLFQTLIDGIPFYQNSIIGTIVFGSILFGGYFYLHPRFSISK
jgi:hypothetical protein